MRVNRAITKVREIGILLIFALRQDMPHFSYRRGSTAWQYPLSSGLSTLPVARLAVFSDLKDRERSNERRVLPVASLSSLAILINIRISHLLNYMHVRQNKILKKKDCSGKL